jgi:transcriptional antiterminator RfaH
MSKEWFILQFKPNAHHQAVKNLNQQGFETFLPLHSATLRKACRFINTKRPLFPGYMFITFDKATNNWAKINNTYGVSRLLIFNSVLQTIPNRVIDSLKARCDCSGYLLPEKKFKYGDQVELLTGPFANFIAKVESYETDQRIWILMDLMGRKSKIQAEIDKLRLSN